MTTNVNLKQKEIICGSLYKIDNIKWIVKIKNDLESYRKTYRTGRYLDTKFTNDKLTKRKDHRIRPQQLGLTKERKLTARK